MATGSRNAPEPQQVFTVATINAYDIGALDQLFTVEQRTPPTLVGEIDPKLLPEQYVIPGNPPPTEFSAIDHNSSGDDIHLELLSPELFVIPGNPPPTEFSYTEIRGSVELAPIDDPALIARLNYHSLPTLAWGVDPDAECNNRPQFGLLYPRRST